MNRLLESSLVVSDNKYCAGQYHFNYCQTILTKFEETIQNLKKAVRNREKDNTCN